MTTARLVPTGLVAAVDARGQPAMRVAITESVIAEARRRGGSQELWDATVRGLALRILATGRASWPVRTWTGRSRERAPDQGPPETALPVAVLAVRVPEGVEARRNPVVLADAVIGPVTVRLGVFAMKRGKRIVRPPEAADRSDGVILPDALREIVADAVLAAVDADPEARAVLARHQPNGRP